MRPEINIFSKRISLSTNEPKIKVHLDLILEILKKSHDFKMMKKKK